MENQKTFKISGDLMCSIIANDAKIGVINSYRNFLIDSYNAGIDEIHAGNIDGHDFEVSAKFEAIEMVINDLFILLKEMEQETNKIIDDNKIPTLDFTKLSDIEVPIKDEYKKTVPVFIEEGDN